MPLPAGSMTWDLAPGQGQMPAQSVSAVHTQDDVGVNPKLNERQLLVGALLFVPIEKQLKWYYHERFTFRFIL